MKKSRTICKLCGDEAIKFQPGIKGGNSDKTKFMFVLHKPDTRIMQPVLGFADRYDTTLGEVKTGKELGRMLRYLNLDMRDIYLTNLFKCVLNSDRDPGKRMLLKCLGNLDKEITEFNPRKIVLFGTQVYNTLFPGLSKLNNHKEMWTKKRIYKETPVFFLPHPSKAVYFSQERRISEFYEPLKEFLEL